MVVTQPSVSGAIAALEREVGTKLVGRRGRGIGLTAAGEALVPFASRALGFLEDGRTAALEAADRERQELKIAAVNTAGEYIVPAVLRILRRRHPLIDVRLEVSNRARVFHQVEMREADVGIGGSPPESGELEGMPFLHNELVVIASPEHPLASGERLSFRDLGKATWLLRENGSGTRIFTEWLFAEKGIKPPVMTIGSNGAIKQSAQVGLGISLQSRLAVALELSMGLLCEVGLEEGVPSREWYALYSKDGPRRSSVSTFLEFLRESEVQEALAGAFAAPAAEG